MRQEMTNVFNNAPKKKGYLLMCKDIPVYDIDSDMVLDTGRVPGLIFRGGRLSDWISLRQSSQTNVSARSIKNMLYRNYTRAEANILNRALSLSDCYWIKEKSEEILFEDVSPYFYKYWEGGGKDLISTAKPTLHVNGYRDKYWVSPDKLFKKDCYIEICCSWLCELLGIPACKVEKSACNGGIMVQNFTNTSVMLESCDMSGIITEDSITTNNILKAFGVDGFKMLVLDAIIGNGDRHSGNFGFLKNADTGECKGMAPLYDFDHALDSKAIHDVLTEEIVNLSLGNREYWEVAIKMLDTVSHKNIHTVFRIRADNMLQDIYSNSL